MEKEIDLDKIIESHWGKQYISKDQMIAAMREAVEAALDLAAESVKIESYWISDGQGSGMRPSKQSILAIKSRIK